MTGQAEVLQILIHGDAAMPTLIYLPGIHGDWTLVRGFREALKGRLRFVEITYPRTLTWSLDDYAAALEISLAENGITKGWLLGESFGSQVTWAIAGRKKFGLHGIILAGGFIRHPLPRVVGFLYWLMPLIPVFVLRMALRVYEVASRFRFRRSPLLLASFGEFIGRRNMRDWHAMRHRLRLIRENDPRPIARELRAPLYAMTGAVDPIVPWAGVKPWLEKNCPGFRGSRMIFRADHVVLATAPEASVEQVLKWILETK